MIDFDFTLGGVRLHVAAIVVGVCAATWLVLAVWGLLTRNRKRLFTGAAILAAGWLFAFGAPLMAKKAVVEAAAIPGSTASCASIRPGMSATAVRAAAGEPDEIRNEEAIRGPGAVAWIYRGSRCAIHLTDDKVVHAE